MEDPYAPPNVPPRPPADDITRHLQGASYPLRLSFKILALARQATVTDAAGRTILFTRQKLLKFKEQVEVFTDSSRATQLAEIRADRVIDWSARYNSWDARGAAIGSVGRRGWRSLWRAHYEVFNPGDSSHDFDIREENPGAKILDSLLGEIPIVGFFTGFICHPRYLASRPSGEPVMRLTKEPAFWEGRFRIDRLAELPPREELNLLLALLMLVLLERRRG